MKLNYPVTPVRPVVEKLHGVEISDPFRWLEDEKTADVKEWIEKQNQLTEEILQEHTERSILAEELLQYIDAPTAKEPRVCGDKVFYMSRKEGQDQEVLCWRYESESEEETRVLVDPNTVSDKGIIALDWWYPSPDGKYVAYGLSANGDEWSTLYLREVVTNERLKDTIPRTRYSNIAWKGNEGFYYTRYPQKGEVPDGEENYHQQIYYHQLGTPYEKDPKIFGAGIDKKAMLHIHLSPNDRYLLVHVHLGWTRVDIYVADLENNTSFIELVKGVEALFYGHVYDDELYLITNYKAPNYRIVKVNLQNVVTRTHGTPDEWPTVVSEDQEQVIENFRLHNNQLIVNVLKDAASDLMVYDLAGESITSIEMPQLGTVSFLSKGSATNQIYLIFESFIMPASIYQLDLDTLEVCLWAGGKKGISADDYLIQQVFYSSKDGTQIPMFIIHHKDLEMNGQVPTILHGYGGFNVPKTPQYTGFIFPWIEHGGIFALACLRGGGEYGEKWHRAGMLENKQNVFDDFITAGEYLIAENYTDQEHLGIYGRSNGGLLVGATLVQRPDLFQAVVCVVPLLDMLRYHKFLLGALWTAEYGSPDIPEEFAWLYAYSPYHNIDKNVKYPATLFNTAISDSRVAPLHAMKMAARLQTETDSDAPILLRVEAEAGHGVGKPIWKLVQDHADMWSFMAWQLGLEM